MLISKMCIYLSDKMQSILQIYIYKLGNGAVTFFDKNNTF